MVHLKCEMQDRRFTKIFKWLESKAKEVTKDTVSQNKSSQTPTKKDNCQILIQLQMLLLKITRQIMLMVATMCYNLTLKFMVNRQ